jgi:hypothetical protein
MSVSKNPRSGPSMDAAADPQDREALLAEIVRAIETIDFGSVLIKIHEGEVVGIETSTKVRFKGGR